jgi:hypothetical protein
MSFTMPTKKIILGCPMHKSGLLKLLPQKFRLPLNLFFTGCLGALSPLSFSFLEPYLSLISLDLMAL